MQASLADKSSEFLRSLPKAWRLLGPQQRVAAVGSLLLIVSTFGPFTWVEVAEILTALGVLALLKKRTDGSVFHLPFGDGTAIAAAGLWCGLLILVRLFDRPLGQNLLALACAALIFGAGMRERAKRPMDDLPPETVDRRRPRPRPANAQADWLAEDEEHTERIPRHAETTERLSGPQDRGSEPEPPQR